MARLLPLALLCHVGSALAQQTGNRPIFNLGDAVVTGFSGTVAGTPLARSRKSATDLTFINPDGSSVVIFDVGHPTYVWDGRLLQARKTIGIAAKDVGQVFGVALDDAPQPNIYVAATSVFGLNIVSRARDGSFERRKKGRPGAGWMRGQFGLELQGGPGAIYKIDGRTGAVSLFANVTLDGVPNPGPGLGNLAFDAEHQQLFVSDLYTGMIHRFDLSGRELGTYDHGVTGLGAAKLPTVAFDAKNRPNIASDRFDSEKPATWGYAPLPRRVWGLAVHDGRLYYSVAAGPQIWSVGIAQDGSFAADPRWEADVPAQAGPLPVSDIAFSRKGAMILAQRALVAGAYDYSAFTRPGEPAVFRLWLRSPNDPPSPGRWKSVPEEYAVGFAGNYRNTNGGVALGYGYDAKGALSTDACEYSLWTTGQNLRNAPSLKDRLDPGGPLVVNGLQGAPASPVRDFNAPPWMSYFIDYDGTFTDPKAAGHLGSVRIYTRPCASPVAYGGPGYAGTPPYIGGRRSPPPDPNAIDVGINKTGSTTPAQQPFYIFDLTVTNNGAPFTGANNITVTDTVPPNMTFNTVSGTDWNCVPPGGPAGTVITCTYTGAGVTTGQVLPPIHIDATATGEAPYPPVTNCATVSLGGGNIDTDASNNQSCVTVTKPHREQMGELLVIKHVVNNGPGPVPTQTYPVTVACGSNSVTLNLADNVTQTAFGSLTYGTQCNFSEPTPPTPPLACPPKWTAAWTTAYAPSNPLTINLATQTVTVTNTLDCTPPRDGAPPKCPDGEVERHGKCVKPVVCHAPAKLNRRGTACFCPKGMTLKGNTCEESHQPRIRTEDVIRVVPGLIPGIGGGGHRSRGGGGEGGGKH